jgi:SAM-dependent methyltransferase
MPTDTGTRLRALYEPEGGVAQIFSPKVADYLASRPDYPAGLFDSLGGTCGLREGAVIADIGAGTGLLTHGLLQRGYQVIAVEPNPGMRAAADRLLSAFSGYRSEHGSAESIPMPPSSIDLITAAQAFHWFDVDKSRAEFLRVLRPEGKVALIWNDRVLTDPLHIALDEIFTRYGGAKRDALVAHESGGDLPKFFGSTVPAELRWQHEHCLDQSALLSLVFSRSYMPDRSSPPGQEVSHDVCVAFQRFAIDAGVIVRYTTVAIVGRPSEAPRSEQAIDRVSAAFRRADIN